MGAFCARVMTTSPGITACVVTRSVRVTGPAVELELVTAIGGGGKCLSPLKSLLLFREVEMKTDYQTRLQLLQIGVHMEK